MLRTNINQYKKKHRSLVLVFLEYEMNKGRKQELRRISLSSTFLLLYLDTYLAYKMPAHLSPSLSLWLDRVLARLPLKFFKNATHSTSFLTVGGSSSMNNRVSTIPILRMLFRVSSDVSHEIKLHRRYLPSVVAGEYLRLPRSICLRWRPEEVR